ncbi:MAG: CorA family divalent cation transporter [Candidatus Pacebacteria bacterium]|nr:CorA family divalent cation transporter [Candidatus Paceibacterota bacterium]
MKSVKNKNITWYDFANPSKKDIEVIKKIHKFHPIILDELIHPSARSRVENYDSYLFLTYHLPTYDPVFKTSRKAEIDFLITKDAIITVHYENLEPLNDLMKNLNGNADLAELIMEDTGRLIHTIMEEIINFSMRQLRHIEENVMILTKELFMGKEEELLKKISYAKRDILDYGIICRPQSIILHSLRESGIKFWGNDITIYLSDLVGDHLKVTQQVENYKETIESLESTNTQLLNAKTSSIMKRFSVLAFLAVPSMMIMSFFTVGAIEKLVQNDTTTFLIGFFGVISITALMMAIFKKKGWV